MEYLFVSLRGRLFTNDQVANRLRETIQRAPDTIMSAAHRSDAKTRKASAAKPSCERPYGVDRRPSGEAARLDERLDRLLALGAPTVLADQAARLKLISARVAPPCSVRR